MVIYAESNRMASMHDRIAIAEDKQTSISNY